MKKCDPTPSGSLMPRRNSVVGERVVIGGFYHRRWVPRSGIARLAANGPVDQSFDPGGERYGLCCKFSPIQVLIGGAFTDSIFMRFPHCPLNSDGSITFPLIRAMLQQLRLQIQLQAEADMRAYYSFDGGAAWNYACVQNGVLDTSFIIRLTINRVWSILQIREDIS